MVELSVSVFSGLAPVPGVAKPDPILTIDDLHRSFGGVVAVDVDHLEIQRGAITGLIGPNGAGKTTLFNLLTAFDRADAGTWTFNGERVAGLRAHGIARKGMVRTFQLTRALAKLTVMENMMLGATDQEGERFFKALVGGVWREAEAEIEARAEALLERFNLADMRYDYAGTLSGGQRKLLELARALMVQPDLLMLDEPMAGVNPALVESLLDHITSLRDQGMTVLFIAHDMDVVRTVSEWVVAMADGRVIAEAPPSTVVADRAVIEAYLAGTGWTTHQPRQGQPLRSLRLALGFDWKATHAGASGSQSDDRAEGQVMLDVWECSQN